MVACVRLVAKPRRAVDPVIADGADKGTTGLAYPRHVPPSSITFSMAFGATLRRILDTALPRPHPVSNAAAAGPARTLPPARGQATSAMSVATPPREAAVVPPMRPGNTAAVEAFVASIRHLPLFSGTAMQIVRTIGRDDVTIQDLTRLIATDGALVAHLLRIVNSPFYGLAQRVGTVGDALSVLGFDQARRTITAAILQRPLMTYLHDSNAARAFWRHELGCAALARHLASRRAADGEVAYMAGVMHDIGRLAMLVQFPEHIDVLLHVEHDDAHRGVDRERVQFGFDHAQVGGALLALWGLPAEIVRAAERHEDDVEPGDAVSASVWHANRLTHDLLVVADDDTELPWMTEIGLDVATRCRILDEITAFEEGQG